uniref:B30.2/SPRY domain-containing protein n=1 Tax=Petromyzon marinus TaxID=7757 RepID=S4RJI5_PETMA
VVCNNCVDGQTPAVKTCAKCETSYCAAHLRPHLENPRLSDHVLVAPIVNLDERRCRQHRQELIHLLETRLSCCLLNTNSQPGSRESLFFTYHGSPTLDTNSAHDKLQISSDLRTVTWSDISQGRPHHPHRFDWYPQALCSESFSSGQHYWEVDVGSVEECSLGGSDDSWSLQKRNNSFFVWHGGVKISLSLPEPPRRVGVHLDWDTGLLSFYNADSMMLLHSVRQTFAQPLQPGLWVIGVVTSPRTLCGRDV